MATLGAVFFSLWVWLMVFSLVLNAMVPWVHAAEE